MKANIALNLIRSAKARDQGGRDDGEHQLVDHERLQRNGSGIVGVGLRANST